MWLNRHLRPRILTRVPCRDYSGADISVIVAGIRFNSSSVLVPMVTASFFLVCGLSVLIFKSFTGFHVLFFNNLDASATNITWPQGISASDFNSPCLSGGKNHHLFFCTHALSCQSASHVRIGKTQFVTFFSEDGFLGMVSST